MVAQIDNRFIRTSLKKTWTRLLSYALYEGRPLTTRGRWINPLVFLLYRLQACLPTAKSVVKPVFILGVGRSGTTILGITLAMHRDVGFLNEPKAMWSYWYDNEDVIGSYREKPGNYRLDDAIVTDRMRRQAHHIYGNYLRFSAASKVVDKYPELIFRIAFVLALFADARFIFLYRDGRDTCSSIQQWSQRLGYVNGDETHDWWGLNDRKWQLLCDQIVAADEVLGEHVETIRQYSQHWQRAAVEWIVSMKEGLAQVAQWPDTILAVKYEDYVDDVDTRRRVLAFCDLAQDDQYEHYCETVLKPAKHHADIELPDEIQAEFMRVMGLLGYV